MTISSQFTVHNYFFIAQPYTLLAIGIKTIVPVIPGSLGIVERVTGRCSDFFYCVNAMVFTNLDMSGVKLLDLRPCVHNKHRTQAQDCQVVHAATGFTSLL